MIVKDTEILELQAKLESAKKFIDMITALPTCNDCYNTVCVCKPRLGETVRYNCPLHVGKRKER